MNEKCQLRVVAPLLFQTAFNFALYPPVAGISSRLYELAPMRSRRFTKSPGTSLPTQVILSAGTVSFLGPCQGSRLTEFLSSSLPVEEGTSSAGSEDPTVSCPLSIDTRILDWMFYLFRYPKSGSAKRLINNMKIGELTARVVKHGQRR